MQIRLLRHATCVLRFGDLRVLTDPMLSRAEAMDPVPNAANTRRIPLVELPLDAAGLDGLIRRLDAVLVTHLHRDHFDARAGELLPRTLPVLCPQPDAGYFGTLGFEAVVPIGAETEWRGVHVTRTGGRHGTGDVGRKMGAVSGFILRAPAEPTVYLAGDTIWCEEAREAIARHRPDVIVVNSGAAQFLSGDPITMTAEDVIRVCRAAPAATVVAVHLGALNHCLLTRADLGQALDEAGLLSQVRIPADGETLTFSHP